MQKPKLRGCKLFNKLDIGFTQCKPLIALLAMYSETTNHLECIKICGGKSNDGTVTKAQSLRKVHLLWKIMPPWSLNLPVYLLPKNSLQSEARHSTLIDDNIVHMSHTQII